MPENTQNNNTNNNSQSEQQKILLFLSNKVKWGLIFESHRHNVTHLMAEYTRYKNISFIAIVYTLIKKSKYLDQHLKRKSILHPYLYPV